MTVYPAQIDNTQTLPTAIDNQTPIMGITVNQLRDAILSVETALGVQPGGIYGSVAARLITIETTVGNLRSVALAGDLGGTYDTPLVIGIQGYPVSNAPPSVGDILVWNGIAWIPSDVASHNVFFAAGDLSGNGFSQNVIGLQNHPISSTVPTTGQVLEWNGTSWTPNNISSVPSGPAGGDLTGSYPNPIVISIYGATVPISGSLTTGNILQVSSSNSLTYASLNLAGGSNYVTGVLPTGNQADQIMIGDVTGNTGASTVVKIQGNPIDNNAFSTGSFLVATSTSSYGPRHLIGDIAYNNIIGTATISTVITHLQGTSVDIVPADLSQGQVLFYDGNWISDYLYGDITGQPADGSYHVTGLQNITVPVPSGSNTVLTYNSGAYTWSTSSTGITQLIGDVLAGPGSGSQTATVTALQTYPISPVAPSNGYVLTWDQIDGYWYPAQINASGAVIFEATLTGSPENITSARTIDQSPTTTSSSFQGIVNLSSDTSGATTGANANFVTIIGGDQNSVNGNYGTIIGGLANTVNEDYGTVIGGSNNTAAGIYSIAGGYNTYVYGEYSTAFGNTNEVTSPCSFGMGTYTSIERFGQFSLSSSGSIITGFPGDAQNGNVVYSAVQPSPGTSFVLSDFNGEEFTILNQVNGGAFNQYYSINIRIVAIASNAAIGPAMWNYDVLVHTVGGFAVISGTPQQNIITPDPNLTGWTSSVTVDGTTNRLHITINPNTDTTNTITASADVKWIEIAGFAQ